MRRTAFVIALLTASISSAHSQPYPYDIELPDHVRWQELMLRPTSSPGIDVVEFRGTGGRLGWLRISPMRGVDRVDVEYVNLPVQSFWADRRGRARDQVVELDRNARIRRIVIFSQPRFSGMYGVFGG